MLINSKWLLKTDERTACIILKKNGQLRYYEDIEDIRPGKPFTIQRWEYQFDRLILNLDGGQCTYNGIVIGTRYFGKATNRDGRTWSFKAKLLSDEPSSELQALEKLLKDYQWVLKPYHDPELTQPASDSATRYMSFHADGSVAYLDHEQEPFDFEKKDSWVLFDERLIARVNWAGGRYVAYVMFYYRGEVIGKVRNKKGKVWYARILPYQRLTTLESPLGRDEQLFSNQDFSQSNINHVGEYHKYWLIRNELVNPAFDQYSRDILRLKDGSPAIIEKFYKLMVPMIESTDACFCYVPSSTKEKLTTGIRELAKKLASIQQRTDATACIRRTKTIPKAAHGGARTRDIHLGSLRVEKEDLIKGKDIILLDDVTTSGTSLMVCRDLLLVAGARKVYCLALAKTT